MATTRPDVSRVWASKALSANIADPDTVSVGKVNLGWEAEIPPFQWFNWLLKRNDELKVSLVERGIAAWGAEVSYLKGALAYNDADGFIYVSMKANKGVQPDSDSGINWLRSAVQVTQGDFQKLVDLLNSHVANKNNPHNLTAAQLNAYTKAQVDANVKVVQDDLSTHKNRKDNPHGTTATQAGAVPITGGTYTGDVSFTQAKVGIGSTATGIDTSNDYVRMFKGDKGLGLNNSDKPVFSVGSLQNELLYTENFLTLTTENNPTYQVPTPDVFLPLSSDTCIAVGQGFTNFSRSTTKQYTNMQGVVATAGIDEPTFTPDGMHFDDDDFLSMFPSTKGLEGMTFFFEFTRNFKGGVGTFVKDSATQLMLYVSDQVIYTRGPSGKILSTGKLAVEGRLLVTFNTETAQIYMDGVLVAEALGDFLGPPSALGGFTYIGEKLNGTIKNLKVWYKHMTPEQCSTL